MKIKSNKPRNIVFLAASVLFLGWGLEQVRSERAVSGLLVAQTQSRQPGASLFSGTRLLTRQERDQQKQQWRNRNRRFAQLWLSRQQKNVTKPMIVYLSDPELALRERAVRALGRLEDPQALPKLQAMLNRVQGAKSDAAFEQAGGISPVTLQLAIARIQARNMRGQAKLDAVAKGAGIQWRDVVKLSQKVNARNSYKQHTSGAMVLREMLDVLYRMGKDGTNIRSWAKQLTLTPAQRVFLQGANLSKEQEIKLILDYVSQLEIVRDDIFLRSHLSELQPQASDRVIQRLLEMKRNRARYPHRNGYVELFYAAVEMNDQRVLPLLKHFEGDANPALRHYAVSAQEDLKKKSIFVAFPLP